MPTYDFFGHDRFRMTLIALADLKHPDGCGVGEARLFGHVAMIERWLCDWHDDGDLTGVDPDRFEVAAGWFPPEVPITWNGRLYAALTKSGLLYEENGCIRWRGWTLHAPEYVKRRLRRRDSEAEDGRARSTMVDHEQPLAPPTSVGSNMVGNGAPRVELSRAEGSRAEQSTGAVNTSSPSASSASVVSLPECISAPVGGAQTPERRGTAKRLDAGAVLAEGIHAGAAGAGKPASVASDDARLVSNLFTADVTREIFDRMKPDMKVQHVLSLMGCDSSFRVSAGRRARSSEVVLPTVMEAFRVWATGPPGLVDKPGGWVRDRLKRAGVVL